MTIRFVLCLLAVMGLFSCPRAYANPMLHAAHGEVVDGKGQPVLLRCVNLSPWLEPEGYLLAPGLSALTHSPSEFRARLADLVGPEAAAGFWRQWRENFVTEDDFRQLHDDGFNCVRLPLNAKDIAGDDGKLDEDGLKPADKAVAWGARTGIYVILDLHAAPGGQNPQPTVSDVSSHDKTARLWVGDNALSNQARTVALWQALAARYAKAKSVGGYDLLNEPVMPHGVPKDVLQDFYREVIGAVRHEDANHMVIVEGGGYARSFDGLRFDEPNLMYEFHEYAKFNAAWKHPSLKALQPLLDLRADTGKPLWLGEFGEDRAAWQADMVSLMRQNNIGWAVWPWKRVAIKGHPVIETIKPPAEWAAIAGYLTGRPFAVRPAAEVTDLALDGMLAAIKTENCLTDDSLAAILAGKDVGPVDSSDGAD